MNISIVIPCYNVEKYVRECLESVVSQTYKQIELICVNDGSSDNTRPIIEEFIKNCSFEAKIIDRPNGGQCAARNTGAKIAGGDYIHFLDSDDLMLPGKLENIAKLIKRAAKPPSFIVGDYIRRPYRGEEYVKRADRRAIWYGMFSSQMGISSALTFKRECLKEVNYWNEQAVTSVDYELMFRLLQKGCHHLHDPAPLIVVRERDSGSITQTNTRDNLLRFINLRVRMLTYLRDKRHLDTDLEQHAYQSIFTAMRVLYNHDPEESIKLYNYIIPNSFAPEVSAAMTQKYIYAYTIFGFKNSQKIWKLYHSIFRNNGNHLKERIAESHHGEV